MHTQQYNSIVIKMIAIAVIFACKITKKSQNRIVYI